MINANESDIMALKGVITMKDKCPVCGKTELAAFDTCEVCGWSNDRVQKEFPDMKHGDNYMSLSEAREAYKRGEEIY